MQYLNGCSKYFATDVTDQLIPSLYKSEIHKTMGPLKDSFIDDYIDFQSLDQSMTALGFVDHEKMKIYEGIAGILHLGNVNFEGDMEGCNISDSSVKSLELAASLLHFGTLELRQLLISKTIVVEKMNITCVN